MQYLITLLLLSSIYSAELQLSQVNIKSGEPATVSCTGNARNTLKNNRLIVYMKIETKHQIKVQAYDTNVVISNRIVDALKGLGLNESSFETISFTITEQYKFVFNKTKNITESVLDGYKATNELIVRTLDLNNSGSIIDTIVRNEGIVSAVNFDVTEDLVKNERLKLITTGIQDCKNQLNNVLDVIGYSLQKYTSINIEDLGPTIINQARPISSRAFASEVIASSGGSPSPRLISGDTDVKMKINVSVNITKNNP
jgi:uncharacterized protein YggE